MARKKAKRQEEEVELIGIPIPVHREKFRVFLGRGFSLERSGICLDLIWRDKCLACTVIYPDTTYQVTRAVQRFERLLHRMAGDFRRVGFHKLVQPKRRKK